MRYLLSLLLLASLCVADDAKDQLFLETLARLPNIDVNANPKLKAKLNGILDRKVGSAEFVGLIAQHKIIGRETELLAYALTHKDDSAVTATKLVLASEPNRFADAVADSATAESAIVILGLSGDQAAVDLLLACATDATLPQDRRSQAVTALAKSRRGEQALLTKELPTELKLTAGSALAKSTDAKVRERAAAKFPMPAGGDNAPLPALHVLVASKGEASKGQVGFMKGGCIGCHKVGDLGIEFGPNLSEIGNKLSREAMFMAILDPSAGISHGFEGVVVRLKDGREGTGFAISDTDELLALRMPGGLRGEFPKAEIVSRTVMHSSLMPPGLQQAMSTQEFIDLVTWLQTLKKQED
ncbi:MAG: putative heme-binding domain-containing protein [Rhodothermales bacterium]|jgi:putative heme-binding domain-containing protein